MEGIYNIHRDIVNRCIAGDSTAYGELYQLYSKAMYNVCLRITGNTGDAEDVLQESFVSAFSNIHKFKGDATFGAWIKRIVVNKSINHIRKHNQVMVDVDEVGIDAVEENHSEYDGEFTVELVKSAMDQLPEGYRMVFSLYLLEGYDHKEIAHILNISESTSKSQFNRSKKKLKEILKEEKAYEKATKRSS